MERGIAVSNDNKRNRLARSGTLNPNAEAVSDELFEGGKFFDRFDLLQVKYEMLRRVENRIPVAKAARDFGFSRRHFYEVQKQFAKGGLQGLMPEKRGPKGAHKLSESVMSFILKVMEEDPSTKAPALAALLENQLGVKVHPRSIERALNRCKSLLGPSNAR